MKIEKLEKIEQNWRKENMKQIKLTKEEITFLIAALESEYSNKDKLIIKLLKKLKTA